MADNWVHGGPAGLVDASYVWLPLNFHSHSVTLERRAQWDLDDPFGRANATIPSRISPMVESAPGEHTA